MSQEPDTVAAQDRADGEVMAAIEDGGEEVLVIADISRDETYLSIPLDEAATLSAWR